ncbi:tetratricopeptide repeat protein [Acidianus sp. RZ1]|uniref:tetratricopeptide repeat protein n=1 Tax=Acidianus sp. RZ1 TaxID=1540082 RepID=UPI001491D13A|nr:tetratricopeptide repeat protein [Acidianus sp. RZ1]NON61555.1 tetratricopeptide repeat protein [Acidianus sp. RZ1]
MTEITEAKKEFESGNLGYALKLLEKVITVNPSKEAYSLMGKILLEMGKDDEALENFKKADDKLSQAKILSNKGKYEEALLLIEDESTDEAKVLRAMILMRLERYAQVKSELDKCLIYSPLFYKIRGISEYYLGEYYEALRDLSRAIDEYPLDAELFYYRGLTKIALGMDVEGENDIDTAINLNPYYAEAYFSKGVLREKRGNLTEAESYYTKTIQINPNIVEAYVRRAKVYMKSGMEEEAFNDIKIVKDLKKPRISSAGQQ